jgi:hypothetical protein
MCIACRSRSTMQTVGTAYPELNLKRWLLEKVSEEKPEGVGEATSIKGQGTTNKDIVAYSSRICQALFAL